MDGYVPSNTLLDVYIVILTGDIEVSNVLKASFVKIISYLIAPSSSRVFPPRRNMKRGSGYSEYRRCTTSYLGTTSHCSLWYWETLQISEQLEMCTQKYILKKFTSNEMLLSCQTNAFPWSRMSLTGYLLRSHSLSESEKDPRAKTSSFTYFMIEITVRKLI